MYRCEDCGAIFCAPMVHSFSENVGGVRRVYTELVCPGCSDSTNYNEIDKCQCGTMKDKSHNLCEKCRISLRNRFIDFLNQLTTEEEEQIDEWLDGNSVRDRRAFQ